MAAIIRRKYTRIVDGKRVTKTYKCWYVQYRDAAGKIQRVKGYTDKGATKQLAAKLEAAEARGEQGLIDPYRVTRKSAIAAHLAEYLSNLEATGADDKYVYNQRSRLNRLIRECGWSCLDDVDDNSFIRWREGDRKSESRQGRMGAGSSPTTLNQYLSTARCFVNWCATTNRIPGIPLAGGKKMSTLLAGVEPVGGEKRRKRRALTDEQYIALLALVGDRALCYRTAINTGLRRDELEKLRWGDMRLIAIKPYIQLRAEDTKARRADRIPLPQNLAEDLRVARGKAKDSDRVFPEVPSIDQWKSDLAAAGIPYKDDMGRQLDFHGGCRQTMCTRMHAAGVPQREAMRRLRVTDPKLLNDVYADDVQLGAGIDALPEIVATPASKEKANGAG